MSNKLTFDFMNLCLIKSAQRMRIERQSRDLGLHFFYVTFLRLENITCITVWPAKL